MQVDAKWLFWFRKQMIIAILSNKDRVVLISNFHAQILHFNVSSIFGVFIMAMKFTRNDDGILIEEYLEERKSTWK